MLMVDLFSGLGGASQAMRDRGWDVITVDNDARFNCTYTVDITNWHYSGPRPDLIWASPPCQAFCRRHLKCFFPDEPAPSMELVNAARRIIREVQPRFFVIENVLGAVPFIGKPTSRHGAFYLWGNYPPLPRDLKIAPKGWGHRSRGKDRDAARRAMIPAVLSEALAIAVEQQAVMEWAA